MYRLVDEHHPLFRDVERVLGFAAFAQAGRTALAPSTIRGYYLKDLDRGAWQLVPRPDVLLLRTDGNPLPGWSQDTTGLWWRDRGGRHEHSG